MAIHERASDAAERAATIAERLSVTSGGATVVFGLTLNDLGVIVGIVGTVVSIAVMIYFKNKHYRLELARARHDGIFLDAKNESLPSMH